MLKRGKRTILFNKKKGQVWVETVIYTLIALSLMGLLLAFAKPKIDSMRDQLLIEQTIDSMNKINDQMYNVQIAPGNKRVLSVKITKGVFSINPIKDSFTWTIDSHYKYSELEREVKLGQLTLLTTVGNPYKVIIYINYTEDITSKNSSELLEYQASPTPYTFVIFNRGEDSSRINLDVEMN